MPPGSTIEVDKAPEGDEKEVSISIVKPAKEREAVGVGAKGGALEEGSDEPEATSPATTRRTCRTSRRSCRTCRTPLRRRGVAEQASGCT